MKKHERARILAIVVSTHLYSDRPIPDRLNAINLQWTEQGKLPTDKEVTWLKHQIDPRAYPELFGGGGG